MHCQNEVVDEEEALRDREQPGHRDREPILELLGIDRDTELEMTTDGQRMAPSRG
jgi:hypothetical protein